MPRLRKLKMKYSRFLVLTLFVVSIGSCFQEDFVPKPSAYFRIDLPEKSYRPTKFGDCPYQFEVPKYAKWEYDKEGLHENCWININYSQYDGQVHISYKQINDNLVDYLEDARQLTNKHIPKAVSIAEQLVYDEDRRVYGLVYNVEGTGAASTMQFFVTDSANHFLRGALYFNVSPNNDSLSPIIDFIKDDIKHMIGTLKWE